MSEPITREEFKEAIDKLNNKIDDIKNNDLDSIETWILHLNANINRTWKAMGFGIGLLAIVITLVELLG